METERLGEADVEISLGRDGGQREIEAEQGWETKERLRLSKGGGQRWAGG